jgi:nucleoside-diphosphate-sugar epimerase
MSKIAGENWCQYYWKKYGVDVRSVRYPGIIGHGQKPGGGTTDYAVEIYHKAVNKEDYECFLSANTALPMLYMEDAIKGTIDIMEAPAESIKVRTSYNLSGMSFTPAEVYAEIQKHCPDFKITYKPDFRQAIADSWTDSIDDSAAREDWGWQPKFDLAKMTEDMIRNLSESA